MSLKCTEDELRTAFSANGPETIRYPQAKTTKELTKNEAFA